MAALRAAPSPSNSSQASSAQLRRSSRAPRADLGAIDDHFAFFRHLQRRQKLAENAAESSVNELSQAGNQLAQP